LRIAQSSPAELREIEERLVVDVLAREVGKDLLDRLIERPLVSVVEGRWLGMKPPGASPAGGIVRSKRQPASGRNAPITGQGRAGVAPVEEGQPVDRADVAPRVAEPQRVRSCLELDIETATGGIDVRDRATVGVLDAQALEVGISGLDAVPISPGLELVPGNVLGHLSRARGLQVEDDDLILAGGQGGRLRELRLGEERPRRQRQRRERLLVLAAGLQRDRAESSDTDHGQRSVNPV
jgi:hypothetical protein